MNTNIVNPKKARRIDSDQFDVGSVTSRMLMGERTLSILCPFIYLPFLYAYAFFGAWMFTVYFEYFKAYTINWAIQIFSVIEGETEIFSGFVP